MPMISARAFALTTVFGALSAAPDLAYAQGLSESQPPAAETPPEPATAPSAAPPTQSPTPAVANESAATSDAPKAEVVPTKAPERQHSLDPKRAEVAPAGRTTFDIDPFADSAMIAVSLGFAGMLELVNSTGEIRPQQIAPNFNAANLIGIDRGAATQTPDPKASGRSSIALGVAAAYAVIDPILSGVREQNVQTGLADAFMYAESVSFTLAMTNVVKMAVRRPRPIAYIEANAHKDDPAYSNSDTDSALSFFSGHTAMTATISATATYLAFARSPHTARPWITLLVGTGLTTFVAVERVRAGAHFPTDVIAGGIAGAGIGVVVPHLHRTDEIKQRRIWVGYSPVRSQENERGGLLNVSGVF
ncbi:MAG TPA: phosphatase PAP2 family protein [Polyangiaceae bacterium]|nr:phosphatase PAP2 family protein [Polyangiaceae bacterium]